MTFVEIETPRDPQHLRERAASALERGLAFVDRKGDALAQLRARVTLEAKPAGELVAALEAHQADDGGFAPLGLGASGALGFEEPDAVGPTPVQGALEALSILADAGSLHAECVERLARHLEKAQRDDGSWGDPARAAADRVFATGLLGGLLARTRFARPQTLEAAGRFLDAQWSPRRAVEGDWRGLAASSVFFGNVQDERSEAVSSWCGRELDRRFREHAIGALPVVRILLYRGVTAVPGAGLEPIDLLGSLLASQDEEGAFAGLTAPAVAPTVDALLAILVLCRSL